MWNNCCLAWWWIILGDIVKSSDWGSIIVIVTNFFHIIININVLSIFTNSKSHVCCIWICNGWNTVNIARSSTFWKDFRTNFINWCISIFLVSFNMYSSWFIFQIIPFNNIWTLFIKNIFSYNFKKKFRGRSSRVFIEKNGVRSIATFICNNVSTNLFMIIDIIFAIIDDHITCDCLCDRSIRIINLCFWNFIHCNIHFTDCVSSIFWELVSINVNNIIVHCWRIITIERNKIICSICEILFCDIIQSFNVIACKCCIWRKNKRNDNVCCDISIFIFNRAYTFDNFITNIRIFQKFQIGWWNTFSFIIFRLCKSVKVNNKIALFGILCSDNSNILAITENGVCFFRFACVIFATFNKIKCFESWTESFSLNHQWWMERIWLKSRIYAAI